MILSRNGSNLHRLMVTLNAALDNSAYAGSVTISGCDDSGMATVSETLTFVDESQPAGASL